MNHSVEIYFDTLFIQFVHYFFSLHEDLITKLSYFDEKKKTESQQYLFRIIYEFLLFIHKRTLITECLREKQITLVGCNKIYYTHNEYISISRAIVVCAIIVEMIVSVSVNI